ncbi:MAG: excinuclease ABC subunit UvrA [Candidatus Moranbacteria bacterium]|nr:excinuclease ABC subunit UvrA [Candidatus Moranbacteria bacterium]
MQQEKIIAKGVKENNLKNIDLEIPKNKIVTITGVSGSGKSSFAFDTLYLEGYRRYMENLSSHAHFFLHSARKPKFEKIENLCPTISISQKSGNQNPRSTVGTLTGIYDFLRSLFAQAGVPYCPNCQIKLEKNTADEVIQKIKSLPDETEVIIAFTLPVKNGDWKNALKNAENMGYSKVVIDSSAKRIRDVYQTKESDQPGSYQVLVDKINLDKSRLDKERIIDSIQTAGKLSSDGARIFAGNGVKMVFNHHFSCPECGFAQSRLTPKSFSFNSPEGACPECKGIGQVAQVDPEKVIPNKNLSLAEGAIEPWTRLGGKISSFNSHRKGLEFLAEEMDFDFKTPVKKLSGEQVNAIIYGSKGKQADKKGGFREERIFEGVAANLKEKYEKTELSSTRRELEKYFNFKTCPECEGKRLKKDFLKVEALGAKLEDLVVMELGDLIKYLGEFSRKKLSAGRKGGTREIADEIIRRLKPLADVGVEYLDLNRSCRSLSGGEFQRIRIATQLYSGLSGVLYVLDEPTIGLHSRDTKRLIKTFQKLKKTGNSIIIVEHDKEIIEASDEVIDFGPGAGEEGGRVMFQGSFSSLKKSRNKTADFFQGKFGFDSKNRKPRKFLEVEGINHNNLQNIDLKAPLGCLASFAGVSGSGKSSLVIDVLAKGLKNEISGGKKNQALYRRIKGKEGIKKVVMVDQSPIGRSPRSNPATYTGVFGYIRELFAETEMAQKKRLRASHFSFNMRGGRCEYCQGEGAVKIDMPLLEDVYSVCPHCKGARYNKKVLEVEYHGVNISQVLDMSIKYAYHFFSASKPIRDRMKLLCDVGLGYLKLGQSSANLSGGEAQRIKLAAELVRKSKGNCLYILDEPTIGLHFSDIRKLLKVLNNLVDLGNSVFVIEHNADLLKASDWVIELGPGGGKEGGEVVFEGTPEELAGAKTETGKVL